MDLKELIYGFLLVGLFLVCIFSFILNFTADNSDIELDTDEIDLTGLESSLNKSKSQAEEYMGSFQSENPLVSFGSLILFSIVGIGKLIITSVSVIFNILLGGMSAVLGIPPIITGVLTAIILMSLIFAVWKLIKTGK